MNEFDREAMCYVVGQVATERMPLMLPLIFGQHEPTDWAQALGCTEDQILATLKRYHERALHRQIECIGTGTTAVSQQMAEIGRAFCAARGDQYTAEQARLTWVRIRGENA